MRGIENSYAPLKNRQPAPISSGCQGGQNTAPSKPDGLAAALLVRIVRRGAQELATRPVRARGPVAYWDRLTAGYHECAALSLRCKFGAALFHLIKCLALGHKQAHTLGPSPDGPAIIGVLDDESRCCCSLSHAQD